MRGIVPANPLAEIVPTVEFPPVTLFTSQVTAVFDVPVTVAVNCCVPFAVDCAANPLERRSPDR